MSDLELYSSLSYVLGKFEGIAFGCFALDDHIQEALLNTCELLNDIVIKVGKRIEDG